MGGRTRTTPVEDCPKEGAGRLPAGGGAPRRRFGWWYLLAVTLLGVINQLAFMPYMEWVTMADLWRGVLTRAGSLAPSLFFLTAVGASWLESRAEWGPEGQRALRRAESAAGWSLAGLALGFAGPLLLLLGLIKPTGTLITLAVLGALLALFVKLRLSPLFTVVVLHAVFSASFWSQFDMGREVSPGVASRLLREPGVVPLVSYGQGKGTLVEVAGCFLGREGGGGVSVRVRGFPDAAVKYLAADPEGRFLYGTGGMGTLGVGKRRLHPLFRIDLKSRRVEVLPLPVGNQAIEYDPGRRMLYVGNEAGKGFFRIDVRAFDRPRRYLRAMSSFGSRPRPARAGEAIGLYHWFPAEMDAEIFIVDRRSNRLLVFFEDADPSRFHEDRGITVWPLDTMAGGRRLYFCGVGFVQPSPVAGRFLAARGILPPGLVELDYRTLEVTRRMLWPPSAGFDVDRRSGAVYLVNMLPGRLHKVEPRTLRSVDSMYLGVGLKLVRHDPRRDLLYVGNYLTGKLYIVSWRRRRVLSTVFVGARNQALLLVPGSGRLFTTTNYGLFEVKVDRLLSRGMTQTK